MQDVLAFLAHDEVDELLAVSMVLAGVANGDGIKNRVMAFHIADDLHLVPGLEGVGAVHEAGVDLTAGDIVQSLAHGIGQDVLGRA